MLSNTIEHTQAILRQHVGEHGSHGPLLLPYGELLLRDGPARLFASLSPDALVEFVAQRFAFLQRRPQPYALRIVDGPPGLGGAPTCSVIEICCADRPFLIDSVQAFLLAQDVRIIALLHPILTVRRADDGTLVSVADYDTGEGAHEAHMCFLVDEVPARQRQGLLEELRAVLADVVRCVDDYPALRAHFERLRQQARGEKGGRSVSRLLQWFLEGSFVHMGYLPCRIGPGGLQPKSDEGLGLFHPSVRQATSNEALAAQTLRFLEHALGDAPFFVVEETTIGSRMHHRGRLTALLISAQPAEGRDEAAVAVGIFTERSLRQDVLEIPVVEAKVDAVMRQSAIHPATYKQREVLNFLSGLPRFELFRLSEPMLVRLVDFVLQVVDEPRTEVQLLPDEESGNLRVLVVRAGREFPEALVQRVRERVEALFNFTAQHVYRVHLSTASVLTLVFFRPPGSPGQPPAFEIVDEAVREELLSHEDRLVRLWLGARGTAVDERFARTLVEALPDAYKIAHPESEILEDISRLEALAKSDSPQFALRRPARGEGVKLVLYGWHKLSLSRVMPIFSNLRVLVEQEETYTVALPQGSAYMHTFLLHPPPGGLIDPEAQGPHLRELIFSVLEGRSENDPLNALLLSAAFDWRQIHLMQLYRNYLMQVGTVYTKRTINETLVRRPRAARALLGVFQARFDPDVQGRDAARREAQAELEESQREIDNLTEDRICKGLHNLIEQTVRTNFYQRDDDPVIAVKLASAGIEQLPNPRPLYEIYVYGPLMEGIHLRGDMIARGGIRYSDRPDDFRTEVLGLMATQQKKNALIVPLGSKGGFVVKTLEPYEGNARAAGDAQYRVFIGALLSLTDNLVQGRPVPPPRVVRHDGDDPYLVVAADKGTAHLSDTANAVSQEMGFWLGDAFASGGSQGYDHKVVGITARGAWESVKRLFWERGVEVQREPITVVGIGDMSGDVFGNGLLASRTLRLVAAFDHRHIFLDPDPDPERSYQERERIFRLPRSAWSDYDTALLSPGGGVYPRGSKSIPLSPQVRARLGTAEENLSGEALIRTLLAAPADLLWNGGIGTYVKSHSESNAEVGDPNNDAVRVDARDLRCTVIGEGGNLGLTQLARIEFDLAGGCLHTDAIDNAGGVNMSDHEVNLKILLGALLEAGQLEGLEARNALLQELEPDVTQAVLRADFRQVLMISMDRLRSQGGVEPFVRVVDLLAAEGGLDRRTEAIPNTQRFQAFENDGHGVPRPVLAVLLAYTKMLLYRRLTGAEISTTPELEPFYRAYFPPRILERFKLEAVQHPLRREIVATVVTNTVIDQAGMGFVPELASLSGRTWPDVVQAYLLADAAVDGPSHRERIYALATTLPADVQYRLLMELEQLLVEIVRWLLLRPREEALGLGDSQRLRAEFLAYGELLPDLLDDERRAALDAAQAEFARGGVPPEAARMGAMVPFLRDFPIVSGLAGEGGIAVPQAFALAARVDERFRLRQLEEALLALRPADRMAKRFVDGLLRTLELQRRAKLSAMLGHRAAGAAPDAWLGAYLDQRAEAWKTYEATLRQVFASDRPEAIALAVTIGQLEAV